MLKEHEVVGAQHAAPQIRPLLNPGCRFDSTIAALNKYGFFTFA
jgi:hypothetical protein